MRPTLGVSRSDLENQGHGGGRHSPTAQSWPGQMQLGTLLPQSGSREGRMLVFSFLSALYSARHPSPWDNTTHIE